MWLNTPASASIDYVNVALLPDLPLYSLSMWMMDCMLVFYRWISLYSPLMTLSGSAEAFKRSIARLRVDLLSIAFGLSG